MRKLLLTDQVKVSKVEEVTSRKSKKSCLGYQPFASPPFQKIEKKRHLARRAAYSPSNKLYEVFSDKQ